MVFGRCDAVRAPSAGLGGLVRPDGATPGIVGMACTGLLCGGGGISRAASSAEVAGQPGLLDTDGVIGAATLGLVGLMCTGLLGRGGRISRAASSVVGPVVAGLLDNDSVIGAAPPGTVGLVCTGLLGDGGGISRAASSRVRDLLDTDGVICVATPGVVGLVCTGSFGGGGTLCVSLAEVSGGGTAIGLENAGRFADGDAVRAGATGVSDLLFTGSNCVGPIPESADSGAAVRCNISSGSPGGPSSSQFAGSGDLISAFEFARLVLRSDIPNCAKYKKEGLQNAYLLEKMFEDIHNTGTNHWYLGQGVVPTPNSDAINIDDENENDGCGSNNSIA
ncbi:hypothetical protein GUJ93_ZPchr0009g2311 [Zizania palustris]|uniref:Uncharacterized protein n=1 Tax=Zizania palustris TaxID=103762 RepID=A0A8J5RRB8_ZIZPA|nr:hypothetical protein GUJ93_ZPchr0009g2311 [Zizania palustris]